MGKINTDMLISLLSDAPDAPEYEGPGFKYLQQMLFSHSDNEEFNLCLADFDFDKFELDDISDIEDSYSNRSSNMWKIKGVVKAMDESRPVITKVQFI